MPRQEGLKLKLTRIPGLTPPGMLEVPYYFQCPPTDSIDRHYGHDTQQYSVIPTSADRGGEYKWVGGRKLRTVHFTTIVVDYAEFIIQSHFDANRAQQTDALGDLTHRLIEISEGAVPFNLLASHHWLNGVEWSMQATLIELTLTENEPDARYLDMQFEEWRDPFVTGKTSQKKRKGGKSWPKVVALDSNDTLYSLARQYYGKDGAGRPGAEAIARQNHITDWGFGTALVKSKRFKVGDKITVPEFKPQNNTIITSFGTPTARV